MVSARGSGRAGVGSTLAGERLAAHCPSHSGTLLQALEARQKQLIDGMTQTLNQQQERELRDMMARV